ncbi:transposase [Candidatus Electronema sp. JM]|uniref:transposase n=1 Tax=Candidatus Electronema sp. JM TaxID=3401571 RepID=UPI003AA7DF66
MKFAFPEDMPGIFSYASAGVTCFGKHDSMSKRRTDVAGALTEDKMLTPALFDGSVNTDVFEAWPQQDILPALPNGAAAVMDNASFHKSERIQEAAQAAGCLVEASSAIFS